MDKSKVEEKLKSIILSSISIDESAFAWDKPRNEFENWDSFAHMQLVSEIESAFGITLEMDEIISINKPSDLIPLVEKKS